MNFPLKAAAYMMMLAVPAHAAPQHVGSWFLEIEKDPFSTKKKTVATLVAERGAGAFLALRCFPEGGLSAVLLMGKEKDYETGAKIDFKYRADEGAIVEETGQAFNEKLIDLPNPQSYLTDAGKASSLYFRISTPSAAVVDLEFKPRGSMKALAQIRTDCPPAPADDKKADEKQQKGSLDKAGVR